MASHVPHNHTCPDAKCGTVWHHDPATIPDDLEAHIAAHSCPKCARQCYGYVTPKDGTPEFCHNGVRCIKLDGSAEPIMPTQCAPYVMSRDTEYEIRRGLASLLRNILGEKIPEFWRE